MRRRVGEFRAGAEPRRVVVASTIASKSGDAAEPDDLFQVAKRLVIQSPTSVAPASSTASGWRA